MTLQEAPTERALAEDVDIQGDRELPKVMVMATGAASPRRSNGGAHGRWAALAAVPDLTQP